MENLFEFDGAVSLDNRIQSGNSQEEATGSDVTEDNSGGDENATEEGKSPVIEKEEAYDPHFTDSVELKDNEESLDQLEEGEMSPASVFYNYLVEQKHLDTVEDFDGTEESLTKALEALPEKVFSETVSKMSREAQDLLSYAFNKHGNVTTDDLRNYFDNYVADVPTPDQIQNEQDAKMVLMELYKDNKVFKNTEDLNDYLDNLSDKGTLLSLAKESLQEQLDKREQEKLAVLEAEKQARIEERLHAQKQTELIINEIESLSWSPERKNIVIQELNAETANRKNAMISQSPKALIQLANFYSYFNEETGEFDLSTFYDSQIKNIKATEMKKNLQSDALSGGLKRISRNTLKEKQGGRNIYKPRIMRD